MFVRTIFFFLIFTLSISAEPRLAAEFEFDLAYFRQGKSIRQYIDVEGLEIITQYGTKKSGVPSVAKVFSIKKGLDPETQNLLARFEWTWELMFEPPKVEIRHIGTQSAQQVKEDVKNLLKLFAADAEEADRLYKHLSSVKANTADFPHLNVHIHASNSNNQSRLEEMKLLQLQSSLEFCKHLNAEEFKRLFNSATSSYSQKLWERGVGRAIGVSRYESRKRYVSIDQDIDRLYSVMDEPGRLKQLKAEVLSLVEPEVIEKLLNVSVTPTELPHKLLLFESLASAAHGTPSAETLRKIVLDPTNETSFKELLSSELAELETLRLLLILRQSSVPASVDRNRLEAHIIEKLKSTDMDMKRSLLSWLSRQYNATELNEFFKQGGVDTLLVAPVMKDLVVFNENNAEKQGGNHIEYLSMNVGVLPKPLRQQINLYRKTAATDPNYWNNNSYHLTVALQDDLIGFLDFMPEEHIEKLFQYIARGSFQTPIEINEALTTLRRKHFFERQKKKGPLGSFPMSLPNCGRWLAD